MTSDAQGAARLGGAVRPYLVLSIVLVVPLALLGLLALVFVPPLGAAILAGVLVVILPTVRALRRPTPRRASIVGFTHVSLGAAATVYSFAIRETGTGESDPAWIRLMFLVAGLVYVLGGSLVFAARGPRSASAA